MDKLNKPMFTIPKLSFKKEHNSSKDSILTMSNDTDGLQHVKYSTTTCSSLAGLISNHAQSICSDVTEISSQRNAQSFGSLAALTAHHLQKSNMTNDTKFHERQQLPNSQFVIPKLIIKKNDNEGTGNVQSLKSSNDENNKKQLIPIDSLDKYPIDTLQKDLSNMHIMSKNYITTEKLEKQLDMRSVINDIRAPSPENWIIDLSTALKEAELLTNCTFNNANSNALRKFHYDTPNLETCMEDESDVMPNLLPVCFNLCALMHVKLPYIKKKKNISMFGKILCRKWKTKKPNLEILVQHSGTVKPFDFSVPYRNANRSY